MNSDDSLDPADWSSFSVLAHKMVDDMLAYLADVRSRPVWQKMPPSIQENFYSPLPCKPQPLESVYEEFREKILPYSMGNTHPRYWGWMDGPGTPLGMLSKMLAAGMNPNVEGFDHAASIVEWQVISWWREIMKFPQSCGGLLVSGSSMANLLGLALARNVKSDGPIRRSGVRAVDSPLVFYCSTEVHSSIVKAVELLGLGSDSLKKIKTTQSFQIDINALASQISLDRRLTMRPACVIANAGTVNTGAIDDLNALSDLCESERLWLHVDGAFGALGITCPSINCHLAGIERAHSLAFDLHKWFYLPFGIGCALFRDKTQAVESFSMKSDYLDQRPADLNPDLSSFSELGIELSREFRALPVWMSIKTDGLDKYSALMEKNLEQARYLRTIIEATPSLELAAPGELNIVCFRYKPSDLSLAQVNALNSSILREVQRSGVVMLSGTILNGIFVLRASITNYRSKQEDFDLLVQHVIDVGQDLT